VGWCQPAHPPHRKVRTPLEPTKAYPAEVVRGTFFEHDIPVENMFVAYRTNANGYARPLNNPRKNYLIANWDRRGSAVLLLSMRPDGRMAIIDGQHRWEAAVANNEKTLDGLVYIDLTIEQEAELYRKFGDYLRQTPLDKYHAAITQGVTEYLAIDRIVHSFGLNVPQTLVVGPRAIVAVDALLSIAKNYKLGLMRETLSLLNDAWDGQPRAYRAVVLRGTAAFLARFFTNKNFNRKRLVARMTKEGISKVEERAGRLREGISTDAVSAWGQALMGLHDARAPEGTELAIWLRKHYTDEGKESQAKAVRTLLDNLTPEQRQARSNKSWNTRHGYKTTDVRCTYCNADVGTPCFSDNGVKASSSHKQRRMLARETFGLKGKGTE
jgi:hypothetical protein